MPSLSRSLSLGSCARRAIGASLTPFQSHVARAEVYDATAFDLSAVNATATATYIKGVHEEFFDVLSGSTASVFTGTSAINGNSFGTQPTPIDLYSKIQEIHAFGGVKFAAIVSKMKYETTQALVNYNFVSGDFLSVGAGAGLKGDALSKYMDPALLQGADVDNDFLLVYETAIPSTVGLTTLIGSSNGTAGSGQGLALESSTTQKRVSVPRNQTINDTAAGLLVASTTSYTNRFAYKNGVSVYSNTINRAADIQNPTDAINIFANKSASAFSDARILMTMRGLGITTLEAEYLSWCVNAWATALGANTYVNP